MLNPIDTLVNKYQVFRQQGGEILGMRHEVALAQRYARENNNPDALAQLDQQAADLNKLYSDWVDTNGRVQSIVGTLKKLGIAPAGLGQLVVPAVIIASIAAVVTSMVLVGGRVVAQRQLLDAVKKKVLTPEQAAAVGNASNPLGGIAGIFGSASGLIIVGVVAWLLFSGKMGKGHAKAW